MAFLDIVKSGYIKWYIYIAWHSQFI